MTLEERDRELAGKCGANAGYTETDAAPILTKDWRVRRRGGRPPAGPLFRAGRHRSGHRLRRGTDTLPSRAPRPRYLRL